MPVRWVIIYLDLASGGTQATKKIADNAQALGVSIPSSEPRFVQGEGACRASKNLLVVENYSVEGRGRARRRASGSPTRESR